MRSVITGSPKGVQAEGLATRRLSQILQKQVFLPPWCSARGILLVFEFFLNPHRRISPHFNREKDINWLPSSCAQHKTLGGSCRSGGRASACRWQPILEDSWLSTEGTSTLQAADSRRREKCSPLGDREEKSPAHRGPIRSSGQLCSGCRRHTAGQGLGTDPQQGFRSP